MISSSQIRDALEMYLSKNVDLDTFEDWLVQKTWNIHLWGSEAAESLAFAIEESLSEYENDHISEEALRKELSDVLYRDTVTVRYENAPNVSAHISSSSVPVRISARL